ncbi:MAG: thiamine pyrophosphate-binding protein [Gemmatimonadota bacterium]
MRRTGGAMVVEALKAEGVAFTFGIPGTHNIELYDALVDSPGVRPVLVTDEQSASFMADGLWRASGRLGCVNVVPGAGLTHALSGIAEAWMDQVPLLILGCGIRRDSGRAFQLHDVDQQALVRSVTKGSWLVESVDHLYETIREACRTAREGVPGPVFVEVPANLYMVAEEVGEDPLTASGGPAKETSPRETEDPQEVAPSEGLDTARRGSTQRLDVTAVLEVIREARRPLLYLGAGAAGAGANLVTLAERLEAPVSTTLQGKGVFPETHPLFLWPGFGSAAPPFVRKIASSCDATLAIGCRFAEVGTGSYGLEPPGALVHVDLDPRVFGRNYPAQVALEADAADFVGTVLGAPDLPARSPDSTLREAILSGHAAVREEWMKEVGGPGVTPAHLLGTLQERLGPDAVFVTDSGNGTFLAVECLRLDGPGKFLAPVDFSCMGYSVPAAIGAKLGCPDVPVVALAGDGAFLMTGMEVLTAAREGVGVMILVLRDGELAQIAQFQETALSRKVASEVAVFDLEAMARGMGVDFFLMAGDEDVARVVDEAAALAGTGKPALVEVRVDYSRKTYFTRGVVKTNLLRLPLRDQARFVGRAIMRKVLPGPKDPASP